MDINYELYKVFYYVATSLSFSEASKKLFISQSAVSQSIKVLENKLDRRLFTRSTKKVQLTPEGEILLKHVEPAMHLLQRGEMQLMEADSLNGGQLRIGASDTICHSYLLPFLKQFHQEYPNVHIRVSNQTSIRCGKMLEDGEADLIVVNYPNPVLHNRNTVKVVKEFQDVFLAGEKYQELKGREVGLEEVAKYPILMLDRQSTTSEFLHMIFQNYQLDLVPEIEISSNALLIDLARIGLGVTFIPDYCVPDTKEVFAVRLREELPWRKLVAVYNEKLPLSQAAEYFLDMLE